MCFNELHPTKTQLERNNQQHDGHSEEKWTVFLGTNRKRNPCLASCWKWTNLKHQRVFLTLMVMSHFISLHFATQQKLCLLHWQSLTWVAGMLMSDMRTWRFRNPLLHSHMSRKLMGQIKSWNHIVSNSRFHRFPFQLYVCTLCGHRWGNTKSLPRFGVTSCLSNSATLLASICPILGHNDIIQPLLLSTVQLSEFLTFTKSCPFRVCIKTVSPPPVSSVSVRVGSRR